MQHLAFIMDGNRRWAKNKGLSVLQAHEAGYQTFKKIVEYVFQKGIKIITVYAFSTENWNRTPDEVRVLLALFQNALLKDVVSLCGNNIQVRFIGDCEKFGKDLARGMKDCEDQTKQNTGGILQIAVNYGGREEIVMAVKKIYSQHILPDDITEKSISDHLYTCGIPDPDMIVRTSGEKRLSGFLAWQSVYSELYFLDTYWPDITEKDIDDICDEFSKRKRRFGA